MWWKQLFITLNDYNMKPIEKLRKIAKDARRKKELEQVAASQAAAKKNQSDKEKAYIEAQKIFDSMAEICSSDALEGGTSSVIYKYTPISNHNSLFLEYEYYVMSRLKELLKEEKIEFYQQSILETDISAAWEILYIKI